MGAYFPAPYVSCLQGGCTVTLVKRGAAETLMGKLREDYLAETGNSCDCFVTSPCDGAGVIVPLRYVPVSKRKANRQTDRRTERQTAQVFTSAVALVGITAVAQIKQYSVPVSVFFLLLHVESAHIRTL